jgi:signal transduction histidine kinase/FixJ family two-component response regulator
MATSPSAKPVKVLVVEDREDDFRYLTFLLGRSGLGAYQLNWASTYAAGQKMVREGGFDVALFDYQLDDGTGIDLLREARGDGCEMPIILLTGNDSAAVDQEASQAGAADYLCKTGLNSTELERTIRYAIRQAAMTTALRQSQQQLELFMRSVPCAVCIRDADGASLFQNALFSRYFRSDELQPPSGPSSAVEAWPYSHDGRHWLVNSFGMVSAQGQRLQGLAAVDITDRVLMENELRATTSLLNGILSSLPVVAARLAPDGTLLESRGRGLETIGFSDGELVGRMATEIMPNCASNIRAALDGGASNFVSEVTHAGRTHYFDNYFRFDAERGRGAIQFAINVTDRVEVEVERNRQAQLLGSIMRRLPVVAGRLDAGGRIVEAQGTGLDQMSGHAESLIGQIFSQLFPQSRAVIAGALRGESAHFTQTGTANGRQWHVEFFVTGDSDGRTGATFFGRDVTERRWLEQQLLTISDAEQQRIGADLHDGLGQQLTGMACLSAALRDRLKKIAPREVENADLIARLASEAVSQTRALARGLCPVQLEQGSLAGALEDLTYQAQLLHGVECRFRAEGPPARCEHLTAIHLYRITQEAIHNATRHGGAKHILVTLDSHDREHRLCIKDDGSGFDLQAVRSGSGAGLRLMSYRANMIGGTFSAESEPQRGTQVSVLFTTATLK